MEIYTVEYLDDSNYGATEILEAVFSNFDKAKKYVEENVVYMNDFYFVTKYVLVDEEFIAIEKTAFVDKNWGLTERCHKEGELNGKETT